MSMFSHFDENIGYDDSYEHSNDGYINDGVGHYDAHLAGLGHDLITCDDSSLFNDHGNAHCILCEVDPLVHAHNYRTSPLVFDLDGRPLVHVDSYIKSDGTLVDSHFRTWPDGIEENNISFK